jgi:hypothetical protein
MASLKHRAVHHALDAIQAGEMAVAAHFGFGACPMFPWRDMRGRAWRALDTTLNWWPTSVPSHKDGGSMGEVIVTDEYGEPRMVERDGFTLIFVEPDHGTDPEALIFDNADDLARHDG